MTERLFLDERNLQQLGFNEPNIRTLRKLAEFVNALERLDTAETAIETAEEAIEDAELSLTSLDTRVDTLEAAGPYVEQDAGAEWTVATGTASRATFATHAAQDITDPPTETEVQAIDDHVVILSQRVKALVDDLKANGALT